MEQKTPSATSTQQGQAVEGTSSLYATCQLPVNSKYIRVLDILPIQDSGLRNGDLVQARLRIIDLEESPNFTALSYVWGDYSPELDFIECGDTKIKVTTNCYSALWHLRKKIGAFTIWVDAVCINQDDTAEKSRQIPLMGDIYSMANAVYVWLGPGTSQTDMAMAYMAIDHFWSYCTITQGEDLMTHPWAAAWSLLWSTWSRKVPPRPYGYLNRFSPLQIWFRSCAGLPYAKFEDLMELLDMTWNTRLWTYQEILLASNPIVVCGDWHAPWFNFERSLLILEKTAHHDPRGALRQWIHLALSREQLQHSRRGVQIPGMWTLKSYDVFIMSISRCQKLLVWFACGCSLILAILTSIPMYSRKSGGDITGAILMVLFIALATGMFNLANLLAKQWKMQKLSEPEALAAGLYSRTAREPKDMAFGLWAVLKETGADDLPAPKYSDDIGDIYRVLATSLLKTTQSLDLLFLAALRPVSEQYSWVPDWSARRNHDWDYVSEFQPTDESGNPIRDRLRMGVREPELPTRPEAYVELDETQTSLTVHARHLSDIKTCLVFTQTALEYQKSEREKHLENLRLLLTWTSWKAEGTRNVPWLLRWVNRFLYQPNPVYLDFLQYLFDSDRALGTNSDENYRQDFNSPQSRAVLAFYYNHRDKDASKVLNVLLSKPKLLHVHIKLCNNLASAHKVLFCARNTEKLARPVLGTCLRNVQVGDQILRVKGLPQLLIARGKEEDRRTVRIVSPMLLVTFHRRVPFELMEGKHETPFVEYRIC